MDDNIAFEEAALPHSTEIWRVVSTRPLPDKSRQIRHTNWFATETTARKHAKWIEETVGGTVQLIQGYVAIASPHPQGEREQ